MTDRTGGAPFPDPSVADVRAYVYGDYVDEVLAYQTTVGGVTKRYYPHYNAQYSVAALTGGNPEDMGQVVEKYSYTAFGVQTIRSSGDAVRSRSAFGFDSGFTGYITDNETGLLHARARQYSPTLGKFIGRDSAKYRDFITNHRAELDAATHRAALGKDYVDGYRLYSAYFIPNAVDPSGGAKDPSCIQRMIDYCHRYTPRNPDGIRGCQHFAELNCPDLPDGGGGGSGDGGSGDSDGGDCPPPKVRDSSGKCCCKESLKTSEGYPENTFGASYINIVTINISSFCDSNFSGECAKKCKDKLTGSIYLRPDGKMRLPKQSFSCCMEE